ncbi:MAG: 30S ribosomal protein S20 [Clostridia bacterium]|nr:30S ribosomal protein S20 [Clostridia bacterium]
MANIRSAAKRARQAEARRLRNRATKSRVRTRLRRFFELVAQGEVQGAREALRLAMSAIDKAVKKGVLHRNTAARRKSRIMKALVALEAQKPKRRGARSTQRKSAAEA